jgi:hypothetical protein
VISSQSGNDHLEEDLAKIGYKLNINVKFFTHPSIFLATYVLRPCIKL